ncbi:sensor histidine kinase [Desulfotalea psychrophila]|uniref:histidine kinase n=1 Tax=Desulfotalea psychrophila (strain LSv54 / DSM 12343) TaxID=177439 RepID=Q6APF4_DESPS|nr:ATP-binding protein [Desulfotalea psychrophila]CAG35770.1 related to two-component system sensor histidine kinase (Ntr family) [Desulfotalea psychrophila LSv54]
MKLFYQLFVSIFLGVLLLIGADSYLRFRAAIAQYETDMITSAIQDGKSISGMISHVWRESGEEKAIELIHDASEAGGIDIRWVWFDSLAEDALANLKKEAQLENLLADNIVSVKMRNKNGATHRYTYVPVDVSPGRKGALELNQTLFFLQHYSRNLLLHALIMAGLFALISGIILYIIINRNIRMPLGKLMAQARRIGNGEITAYEQIVGEGEFAKMSTVMNDMCSRLLIAKEKIGFEHDARLRTLDQLRHTERLSTFGLLAAEIAHELGTPLNVVDGRAKMIIREELNPQEIKECATIIKSQSERMAVIIRQLLEFTRCPKQKASNTNVGLLVKQIIQLLHPMGNKQAVSFELDSLEKSECTLYCDATQIQQVLINLLMNSVQAMPSGGKIYISLTNPILPLFENEDGREQKYLKIRIRDEGEGISKDDLAHIFTPFFTTKGLGTGTGLGLSIAHGMVEEHGGWIDVKSEADNGSCFSVYLPMQETIDEI